MTATEGRLQQLLDTMAALRDPQRGCAWSRAQTWRSLVVHTLEEAYEVADAVARDDAEDLKGELADLLNQVVFYAHIASEQGLFDFDDVVAHLVHKLVERHPDVFHNADTEKLSYEALEQQWEAIKAEERRQRARKRHPEAPVPGELDDVTGTLPALSYAQKLQKRAATAGADLPDTDSTLIASLSRQLQAVARTLPEAQQEREAESVDTIGHIMFGCITLLRRRDYDAEAVLRNQAEKFVERFRKLEADQQAAGKTLADISPETRRNLW